MKTSNQGLSLIEAQEAYRGYPYKDIAGWWTWGYGHKRIGNEPMPTFISQPDAVALLRKDITVYEDAINSSVHVPLSQSQFDALVDFTYNVGVAGFKSSTLLKLLNSGNYQRAADEFPKWDHAHVNGQEVQVQGLLVRRMHERTMFLSQMPSDVIGAATPITPPAPTANPVQSVVNSIKSWLGL